MLSNILFDCIISIFGRTMIKSKEMYVIEHFFKFVRRKIMDRRQQEGIAIAKREGKYRCSQKKYVDRYLFEELYK